MPRGVLRQAIGRGTRNMSNNLAMGNAAADSLGLREGTNGLSEMARRWIGESKRLGLPL
jgi:hypothetical protein